jgi:hypothetical protein
MVRSIFAFALVSLYVSHAAASDVAPPPHLTKFSISPLTFDAGQGDVKIQWCATLSGVVTGLERVYVNAIPGIPGDPNVGLNVLGLAPGTQQSSGCQVANFPALTAYDEYVLEVRIADRDGNTTSVWFGGEDTPPHLSLCQFGPCALVNHPCTNLSDCDGDGILNDADNCPNILNPTQADRDRDGFGDACDFCPDYASHSNDDLNHNGVGNVCECGDQTGDGKVSVLDILGINLVIFGQQIASPLCDTNYDGKCDVRDIVGARNKIFGHPAYCSRYPPPGP